MKELENKLSSREVAEMMEMEHSKLLRKIDGINEDFNQAKIGFVKYWIENTYKDAKGEKRKEFQITKRGCEFLAHKTTGTKGNLFTDKYMDKFAMMESAIENNQLILANKEIDKLRNTIDKFERLTEEAKNQYKPSHKRKLDYNKMIKSLVNTEDEVQLVKDWVFGLLNIDKWEDTCIEDSQRILETITTVSRLLTIKKFEQLSFIK